MQGFRDVAKKDGFRLRAVVAIAALAGKDDARVNLTLSGKGGLAFNHAEGQAGALPASN
jgi:hypothetical protein